MRIVVALGGNALEDGDKPTADNQLKVVKQTVTHIADLIEEGHEVTIAHGNGPQVGRILLQNEAGKNLTPALPLDICGAMSQGAIGYHIQQALQAELSSRNIGKPVVSLITQVVVDANDAGFKNPTKPIGPFYSEEQAKAIMQADKSFVVKEDAGRGWRRVVASPKPQRICELEAIKTLVSAGVVVITCGGGGIPVTEHGAICNGVAAVIDKDFASALLAKSLDAQMLVILTAVNQVAIDYKKPTERYLSHMTVSEAKEYIEQGQFAPGSMLPKVQAAINFVDNRIGCHALITSLDQAKHALAGKAGTVIEHG